MKIAIAPDSFKGSLTADEAADCIEAGFRKVFGRSLFVVKIPMADGGEGTVRVVVAATGGCVKKVAVSDPLGRRLTAEYGVTGDGRTAVIEAAAAGGLPLLNAGERNPLITTSRGTGELIRHAAMLGVRSIILGLGGSATVDGGLGMAQAVGIRFLDARGRGVGEGGGALGKLRKVNASGILPCMRNVRVDIACDVKNPLCGRTGAAYVFGPQKGATPAMVRRLDAGLGQLADVIRADCGMDLMNRPGVGAAGGMAIPLLAYFNARLRSGVELVGEAVHLEKRLRGCRLVVTGEGRIDGQTARGKTPAGVARVAGRLGIPVIAICGSAGPDVRRVHRTGIRAVFTALQRPMSEAELAREGHDMLVTCAEQVARLLQLSNWPFAD